MMMRRFAALGVLLYVSLGARPLQAQLRGVRFEVTSVGDTTITFRSGQVRWVRGGDLGIAVDPRRHDALVARLRVVRVEKGTATAMVTGQTTALSMEHIVVMEEPKLPWYKARSFWGGLVAGATIGAVVGYQH